MPRRSSASGSCTRTSRIGRTAHAADLQPLQPASVSTILRQYDPILECDALGVPLNWDRCRSCNGTGRAVPRAAARATDAGEKPCGVCRSFGCLQAAALAAFSQGIEPAAGALPRAPAITRCEECQHPSGPGIWTPPPPSATSDATIGAALAELQAGREPTRRVVHLSRCDVACVHQGPAQHRTCSSVSAPPAPRPLTFSVERPTAGAWAQHATVDAVWRPVAVWPLGPPNDVRPGKVAVLCLRCVAARRSELIARGMAALSTALHAAGEGTSGAQAPLAGRAVAGSANPTATGACVRRFG